jgi:hypothetical protein
LEGHGFSRAVNSYCGLLSRFSYVLFKPLRYVVSRFEIIPRGKNRT